MKRLICAVLCCVMVAGIVFLAPPVKAVETTYTDYETVAMIYDKGDCFSMQGFDVYGNYLYSIKANTDSNASAVIVRTHKETGVCEYLTDTSTGSIYYDYLGHANDMEIVNVGGVATMFITSTYSGTHSIIRLALNGTKATKVGNYSTTIGGAAAAYGGVQVMHVDSEYVTMLFKAGTSFYVGKLGVNQTSGPIEAVRKFGINLSDVNFGGVHKDVSGYVSQGFGYYDNKIYVPMTGNHATETIATSCIIVYDIEFPSGTLKNDPTYSFWIDSKEYPGLFEIESCAINPYDGKLYFSTNSRLSSSYTNYDSVHYIKDFRYQPATRTTGVHDYRWEVIDNVLTPVTTDGNTYNGLNMNEGSISGNTFKSACYTTSRNIVLKHDRPWAVEWQSAGANAHTMLFATEYYDAYPNAPFIFQRNGGSTIVIGSYTGSQHDNYGIDLTDYNVDVTQEHVYRLTNKIHSDGSNMIYLSVDGTELGAMNNYYIGLNDQNTTSNALSGKDFSFSYIGIPGYRVDGRSLKYIQVWGDGVPQEEPGMHKYRWETKNNTLTSITGSGFTQNTANRLTGTCTDNVHSSGRFELDQNVVLLHDHPWSIEWHSQGSFAGGAMLLSSHKTSNAYKGPFLFRYSNSSLLAFGNNTGSQHENYGVLLSDYGIDGTASHIYRLTNRIAADGSNMVYLYVDGKEIGPMNNSFIGLTPQGTTSNWVSGKDFTFSYIGTRQNPLNSATVDYLQIWENCDHTFGNWVTKKAATCTETGTEERTCSSCGETETRTVQTSGHSYTAKDVAGNCKVYPQTVYTCGNCGDSYQTFDDSITSAWSTTKPSVDASLIETKTQYRYSDYDSTTSYEPSLSGYTQVSGAWDSSTTKTGSVQYVNSWPSGFNTSNSLYTQYNKKSAKVTAGETATTKTVVESDAVTGYLYYHWCYASSYYSVSSKQGSYTTFHAYYSTTNPSSYSYDASDSSYCTYHSGCSNSDWYFVVPVNTQKYTTTQKLYTYERWSAWSDWSDAEVAASDTRKVETQTLYRYVTAELGDHNYVNGVCTVCGAKEPVVVPTVALAGDFNEWDATAAMTMTEPTVGQKTLYLTPGTYEFKIVENGTYLGNNGTIVDTTTTTSDIGWQMTDTNNCKLKVTIPGEYTFTYKTETDYLVVTCSYAPLYLRGSFNDWGNDNAMTDNGNRTYSTTVTLDAGNYTYKVGTSDWTAAWPSEDQALNLTAKSEVTVTLTLKADGNHEVTHTIKPLGSTTTYTCQLAALEVSCDAEVLLRMKMIIGDSIINNDKSYVVMTKDGEDTIFTAADLRAMGTDSKDRYVLEQGIASGEMTYDVTVKIYNGNGQLENIYDYATGAIGTSVTRNVMDYAERIFNLGTQEQKNLIAALVTYGGYSQLHFNTDAGNPAYNALTNCGMSIPNIQSITADSFTQQISRTGNAIGITQTNTRVFLDSAIYMRAYFVLDAGKSIDDYTFTLTYSVNNNERTKTLEPGYDAVNNRYYVDIEDIAAAYLDYMYTITVTNGSGTYVVKTSAMAWAKLAMQATTDVNQINMIKAMYYYNQAANTYFGK